MHGGLRWSVLNALIILCLTFLRVIASYFLDLVILELWQVQNNMAFSLTDLFFLQGIILIIFGVLGFIGRSEEVRKSGWRKTFRNKQRFIWVPNGHLLFGLIITYSGVTMILIYFLNLKISI